MNNEKKKEIPMGEFKASNGLRIDGEGNLRNPFGDKVAFASDSGEARQFFQELRDYELGRWRSKADPSWTAVRDEKVVYFRNEDGKRAFSVHTERDMDHLWSDNLQAIACEYLRAYPQHKPLPTEPGLYGHKYTYRNEGYSRVLERSEDGEWLEYNLESDASALAQEWHDAGELVRLAPVESEDDDD